MGVEGGLCPLRIVRPSGAIKIIYIKFILSQLPLGQPTHCPMGSRRAAPAAKGGTTTYKKQ